MRRNLRDRLALVLEPDTERAALRLAVAQALGVDGRCEPANPCPTATRRKIRRVLAK